MQNPTGINEITEVNEGAGVEKEALCLCFPFEYME